MKLKEIKEDPQQRRALFSDLYSGLEDEITHDIPSRQKPEDDVFSFDKQAFEAQFLFSLFSLIPKKSCRATFFKSHFEVVAFHDHIEIYI